MIRRRRSVAQPQILNFNVAPKTLFHSRRLTSILWLSIIFLQSSRDQHHPMMSLSEGLLAPLLDPAQKSVT